MSLFSFSEKLNNKDYHKYAIFLIVVSILGLFASFSLTMEKIATLENPDYVASCSLNPIVSCSSSISGEQASAFGFPNPFIGIFGFACVLTLGVSLLAGFRTKQKWYWLTFLAGTTFGMLFSIWLIYVSLFVVSKLCLYCTLIWIITIPTFFYSLSFTSRLGMIRLKGKLKEVIERDYVKLTVLCYAIVGLLVLFRWWDFWV